MGLWSLVCLGLCRHSSAAGTKLLFGHRFVADKVHGHGIEGVL